MSRSRLLWIRWKIEYLFFVRDGQFAIPTQPTYSWPFRLWLRNTLPRVARWLYADERSGR